MCEKKGSTTLTIWPPSSSSNSKGSMVIIIKGFYYRSSTYRWKGFNFCGCRLVDKDGSFHSITKTVTREETTKLFLDNIYCIHGFSNDIVSDRGT